jgi:hypothetical protein
MCVCRTNSSAGQDSKAAEDCLQQGARAEATALARCESKRTNSAWEIDWGTGAKPFARRYGEDDGFGAQPPACGFQSSWK